MSTNEVNATPSQKITCAEFREKYRVSLGKLPNGSMIEVTSVVITEDNWDKLPTMLEYREYLHSMYGRNVSIIFDRLSSRGDICIFEWAEADKSS